MKQIINRLFFYTVITTLTFSFTGCEKEKVLDSSNVPSKIDSYVAAHFPDAQIQRTVKDKEQSKVTYEVKLSNGVSLEFNSSYQITDIDGRSKLPDSVIPDEILQYVLANYPTNVITDWELEGNHQQVELDNGVELEFTMDGEFIRVDR